MIFLFLPFFKFKFNYLNLNFIKNFLVEMLITGNLFDILIYNVIEFSSTHSSDHQV